MSDLKEETIEISKERYQVLITAEAFLNCLAACGVDNWDGYEMAQEMLEESCE